MLHQPFGVTQQHESLSVIQPIGRQLGQAEEPVQRAFILVAQADLQAALEMRRGLRFPALTQAQAATMQGQPSEQGFGQRLLPQEQAVHVGEQVLGSGASPPLLEQLGVIEFQQAFEYQRALRPGQAQRLTVERLRHLEFAPHQGLLRQTGQAQQPDGPERWPQRVKRLKQVCPRSVHAPLQMQQPALLRLPARDQLPLMER
ncbi:hypothetical protein D3C87_1476500 [compost metagenome]